MRKARLPLASLGLFALVAPALASQVDRAQVTLGRLVDDTESALIVRVSGVDVEARAVDLVVAAVIDGPEVGETLRLVLAPDVLHDLAPREGQRFALLLSLGQDRRPVAPATVWQAVRLADDAAVEVVTAAVRSRVPTIDGDPTALERALFAQLESRVDRVREDAALDLLAFRALAPAPGDVGVLGRALERAPSPELIALAARLGEPALVSPLLAVARSRTADAGARAGAAAALAALDPETALEVFTADVDAADVGRAALAVEALGALPGASSRVTQALDDPRPAVRVAALRALGERPSAEAIARLEVMAWEGPDARRALAALARAGAGRSLAVLEREHGDAALRELAGALRRDPVYLADEVLRD
jgi:hypothetical protein